MSETSYRKAMQYADKAEELHRAQMYDMARYYANLSVMFSTLAVYELQHSIFITGTEVVLEPIKTEENEG